jgi:hypothetical protein
LNSATLTTIDTVLTADASISAEHRERIRAAARADRPTTRPGTTRQAAEILECHPRTVGRYAAAGLLRMIRISPRRVRFDLGEVELLATRGAPGLG